ncbi:MAG: DNA-directed RNA polymerase subunit omega [Actinobacteria bacterium]|nr:DNA-directed RNA polymerase subunit omega [Actinomycetota bacterium]
MIEDLKSEELVKKVGGNFKLAVLIQKRALELMQGARPLIPREGMTDLELTIREIREGKIELVSPGSDEEKSEE